MRICLFALLIVLVGSPGRAAEISGRIRDAATGEPLGFVNVQASARSERGEDLYRGTLGEADGRYRLTGLSLGRWVLRFSRVGHETGIDSVLVYEDRPFTLDIALAGKPLPLEEVIVEADRYAAVRETQTGFVNLDAEALGELPGVVEGDPIRALELLPGVQTASDYSSGLYVRGGGPDQTLITLDRVPVYNPTHAFGFFSTFNADALADINLYKGAYPAAYGGRLGAVLDIRSRDGDRNEVAGKAGLSTIAGRATLGGPVRDGSWTASLRRTYLDPILDALRRSESTIPHYYFYDGNGRLTVPAAGGQLTLSGYHGRDDLKLDLDADNVLGLRWGNTLATASWGHPWGSRGLLRLQGWWSEYRSSSGILALTTPTDFSNHIRDVSLGAEATRAGDTHKLTGGLQATRYDVRYEQNFNRENQIDYHKTPTEVAAFVEDAWRVRSGTVADLGLRLSALEGGRVLWEPRLGASQDLGERLRAKVGGGLYHQYLQLVSTEALSATDFYVPLDASTTPGQSWQAVAGVEYQPTRAWRTSVETYYTGLRDLVTFNNDLPGGVEVQDAADVFYTGGTGWASGLELFAEKRRGRLTGWIGYTLGWTRRTFGQLNGGEPFPPKYDRRHDLNLVGQARRGKWTFGGTFIYATGQGFTPAAGRYALRNPAIEKYPDDAQLLPARRNSSRLLPYHRLDLSVSRGFSMFGQRAEWYVQVFNVYNRRNEWFVTYDTDEPATTASVVQMLPVIPSLGIDVHF